MIQTLRRMWNACGTRGVRNTTGSDRSRRLRVESLESRLAMAALVEYAATLTDLTGASISTVAPGTEFLLKVAVKDLRSVPSGVFAGYVDVGFDPSKVSIAGPIEYGPNFANGHFGDAQAGGLIDEAGAFGGMGPTAPAKQLLFQMRFQASAEGSASFNLNTADESPTHDTLLFGINDSVLETQTTFVGSSLTIKAPNVPPVITQTSTNGGTIGGVAANQVVNVNASWTDAGLSDTHTATISWGDGFTSTALVQDGAGQGTLAGSHVYPYGGLYTATITLKDQDQAVTTRTVDVYVTGAGVVGRSLYAIGTTGADTISLASAGKRGVSVTASFLGTTPLTFPNVGFDRIVVMAGDGADSVSISSKLKLPALLFGGGGGDTLRGGGGSNILVGEAGNDLLVGGAARDILIGGADVDNLQGQGGDDLVIAGSTAHDANSTALLSLLAEWQRTDVKIAGRIANLRNGTGRNGRVTLNSTTVRPDGDLVANSLNDRSGSNWFWVNVARDVIVGKSKTTVLN